MKDTALELIELICEKIGIVYDKAIGLVPYIAKYNIAKCMTWLFVGAVIAAIGWSLLKAGKKWAKAENEKEIARIKDRPWNADTYYAVNDARGAAGVILLSLCVIVVLIAGAALVKWLFAPEISSLRWALGIARGLS